jgi:8-oxo-dGTP pyrophosphatase MutT (NUDIX family)
MQEDLKARVAAATAIFRGNRILLLRRSLQASNPGIWDLPGGHVESREPLSRAAKRETKEETGFTVRLGPVYHVEVFSSLSRRGKMRQTVGVFYHCTAPVRKEPQLDAQEHSDFAWVSVSELDAHPTVPHLDRAIREAFRTRAPVRGGRQAPSGMRDESASELASPVLA